MRVLIGANIFYFEMIKLHLQGLQSRHLATKVIRDSVNIDPGDWFWFIYILIYIDIDIVTCQYHISINQPTNEMRSTCPCGAARDWRIRSDLETGLAHEGFQAAWKYKYKYKSHKGMEDSQNRRNTGLKKAPTGASWEPGAGQKHLDQMSGLGFPSTQSAAASWELKSSKSQKSTNSSKSTKSLKFANIIITKTIIVFILILLIITKNKP